VNWRRKRVRFHPSPNVAAVAVAHGSLGAPTFHTEAEENMTVSFTGLVAHRDPSEAGGRKQGAFDVDYLRAFAKAHEEGGFDRVLIGYGSTSPDGLHLGTYVTAVTERLGVMLAHRPGFVAPTLAARTLATIDQLSRGRASVHIISGADDVEQQRDGDFLSKDERYARTDEYVGLLRRLWTSGEPFDHEGKYYRFKGGFVEAKPVQQPHIPVFFGGSSEAAIEAAGRHADIYALFGETLAQVRDQVRRVRAAAAKHDRTIGFSLSLRPILADTEAAAWKRADDILARVRSARAAQGLTDFAGSPRSEGSARLLRAAEQGDRLDKRLWTGVARATGARGNTTSLVGTADQVAEALLDYYDLGVTTFLIRGFDPLEDAIQYGRDLIPRVRAAVKNRPARNAAA
jgi:alkanesulfonate monooxygenase